MVATRHINFRADALLGAALAVCICMAGCSSPSDPFLKSKSGVSQSGPIQILIEGDSIALTLAIGMSGTEQQYGVHIVDDGAMGCGVAQGNPILLDGLQDVLPASCDNWPATWKADISKNKPDVVGILVGRWEIVDRMHNRKWMNIGEPTYDTYLEAQIDKAAQIAGGQGAKVVLFTMPYLYPSYASNGKLFPETDPHRVDQFNAMLNAEAAKYPNEVAIVNLNALLDPSGKYTSEVDGIQTRIPPTEQGDWDHISIPGGELLAPTVLPILSKLGTQARSGN